MRGGREGAGEGQWDGDREWNGSGSGGGERGQGRFKNNRVKFMVMFHTKIPQTKTL